jgi:hypothetical protein
MCMLAIVLFISLQVLEFSPYRGGAAEFFTEGNFFIDTRPSTPPLPPVACLHRDLRYTLFSHSILRLVISLLDVVSN